MDYKVFESQHARGTLQTKIRIIAAEFRLSKNDLFL